jgi:hypothetical protein
MERELIARMISHTMPFQGPLGHPGTLGPRFRVVLAARFKRTKI